MTVEDLRENIDPFTKLFNIIYRSDIGEDKLEKLLNLGIVQNLLICDPDKINLEKLKEALFPPEPIYPAFFVSAPSRTIKETVQVGKYNFVNPCVNEVNFPIPPKEFEGYVHLEPLKKGTSSISKINSLIIRGFRPLNSLELLNYSVAHKGIQRQHKIVALGDYWEDVDGKKWIVVVGTDDDGHVVYITDFEGENWGEDFLCAYVKK